MIEIVFASQSGGEITTIGSVFASFIPLITLIAILIAIFYLIYKWSKKKLPPIPPNSSPNGSNLFSGWRIDRILIVVGIIALVASLSMDTSVPSPEWRKGRIHNIGLLNEKQNYLIVSGLILLIGVILNISSRRKSDQKTSRKIETADYSDTKKCPYCAETIKAEAKICRFCGKDQPADDIFKDVPINFTVNIKGPEDPQKLYLATKEFYKDVGVNFEKAKEFLIKGTTLNFENKNDALKIIDKYKQMGCNVNLKNDLT